MSTFRNISELVEKALSSSKINYKTDISEFNRLGLHFTPGQVLLVGSRPAVGRTLFMLFLYHQVWKTNFIPQVFISNEENEINIAHKLISTVSGVYLSEMEEKLADSAFIYDRMLKTEQNIISSKQVPWEELKIDFELLIKEKGIKAFYIDKVQGLFSENKDAFNNRDQELGFIIKEIKEFAIRHKVIFFISSSLSRAADRRVGEAPYLSDIRESGALEDLCDTVLMIYRPEMYGIVEDDSGNSLINVAEIVVRKNRFGPTGRMRLTFNRKIPRFEEFTGYYQHDFDKQFYKTTGVRNIDAPF